MLATGGLDMRRVVVAVLIAGAWGVWVPASSSAASCTNLFVTPSVKPALRAAFIRGHRAMRPKSVGPRAGSTYYGRCGSAYWAAATFVSPATGDQDQPETFRMAHGVWHDLGDDGNLCEIPVSLIRVWHLETARRDVCPST